MNAIPFHKEIFYPESDGQPMAESDLHRKEMTYLIEALGQHFAQEADVYITGNLFLYFKEGDPRSVVAPDLMVVKGVAKGNRGVFKLWEEGHPPCLVVEVTSGSTQDEDLSTKKRIYEHLGVEEYFLFDPLGDYLDPRLQGYRLVRGRYAKAKPEADGSLVSQSTGVTFRLEGARIRFVATGRVLPRYEEAEARYRALNEEAARNRALAEEGARLCAELERAYRSD